MEWYFHFYKVNVSQKPLDTTSSLRAWLATGAFILLGHPIRGDADTKNSIHIVLSILVEHDVRDCPCLARSIPFKFHQAIAVGRKCKIAV